MSDTKSTVSGGIGFGNLLAILFIAFKLLGIINWSWLWVLSPVWIPLALLLLFFVGLLAVPLAGLAFCWVISKFKH